MIYWQNDISLILHFHSESDVLSFFRALLFVFSQMTLPMLDTVNAPIAMEPAGKASKQRDLSLTESQWDSILDRNWEAKSKDSGPWLEDSYGVYREWRNADMSLLPAGLWCDIPSWYLIYQCYISSTRLGHLLCFRNFKKLWPCFLHNTLWLSTKSWKT